MSSIMDFSTVMGRAHAGYEAERGKVQPLGFAYFKATVSVMAMSAACATEAYTMTVALHSQYQALSDGTDLGSDMLPMRLSVMAGMGLAHLLIRHGAEASTGRIGWAVRSLHIIPIAAVIGGMAMFMFDSTSQMSGGDDGKGSLAGMGFGMVGGALFAISFLASNTAAGKLLEALRVIFAGRAHRARVANIARDLEAASNYPAMIEASHRDIAAKEAPDALAQKAAAEAAAIVGRVAATAHDMHASREAVPDDLRPEDVVDLPDIPLDVLDKRQAALKRLNVQFFLNQLKNREA